MDHFTWPKKYNFLNLKTLNLTVLVAVEFVGIRNVSVCVLKKKIIRWSILTAHTKKDM